MPQQVLIVEDDTGFQYVLEKALNEAGFATITAPDYLAALHALEKPEAKVDLLLTDIVMRNGINGFALARMARMRRRDLPILYITAYEVPLEEALGKVLRKPITNEELVAEVRAALSN